MGYNVMQYNDDWEINNLSSKPDVSYLLLFTWFLLKLKIIFV